MQVRAFPDLMFDVLEQSAQHEDQIVTSWQVGVYLHCISLISPLHLPCISWQWSGTHLGPYHMVDDNGNYTDLPASGQRVHVPGIAVDICRNGRIVDHAAYYDENSIRKQICSTHQVRR